MGVVPLTAEQERLLTAINNSGGVGFHTRTAQMAMETLVRRGFIKELPWKYMITAEGKNALANRPTITSDTP